ncbi:MAG: hypothetical protein K0S74_1880 [Chlamydiales bacterium]|jgi:hypothetical protein|nr:hypothetical protein [Chlamydiales bacterium]
MKVSSSNFSYESPLHTPNTSSSEYPKVEIETIPLSPKSVSRTVEMTEKEQVQMSKTSGLLVQASKSWNGLPGVSTSKPSKMFRSLSFGSRSQDSGEKSPDLKDLESKLNKFKAVTPSEQAIKLTLDKLLKQGVESSKNSTFNLKLDVSNKSSAKMLKKFTKLGVKTDKNFSDLTPGINGYIECSVIANWKALWELRNCDWIISVQSTVSNGFSPSMERKN